MCPNICWSCLTCPFVVPSYMCAHQAKSRFSSSHVYFKSSQKFFGWLPYTANICSNLCFINIQILFSFRVRASSRLLTNRICANLRGDNFGFGVSEDRMSVATFTEQIPQSAVWLTRRQESSCRKDTTNPHQFSTGDRARSRHNERWPASHIRDRDYIPLRL